MSADFRRLRGRVAIVGAAESDELGKLPGKSALALHAEAARNALADAGLTKHDVDGVFSAGRWMSAETAEYMGITPRYVDGTLIGGCSFLAHVQHAMGALDAGLCDVALVTHGESGASRVGMPGTRFAADSERMQYEQPFGLAGPPTGYALA
ncbi:MAG: thiolase, partial [Candidatus Binatia bacterium]